MRPIGRNIIWKILNIPKENNADDQMTLIFISTARAPSIYSNLLSGGSYQQATVCTDKTPCFSTNNF